MPGDPNTYLQANPAELPGQVRQRPRHVAIPDRAVEGRHLAAAQRPIPAPTTTAPTTSCSFRSSAQRASRAPPSDQPGPQAVRRRPGSRHTKATAILTPVQISTSLAAGNAYPVGGPYYQDLSAIIPTFDKTKPIIYKWRAYPLGQPHPGKRDRQRARAGRHGRHVARQVGLQTGVSHAESSHQDRADRRLRLHQPLQPALAAASSIHGRRRPDQTQAAKDLRRIHQVPRRLPARQDHADFSSTATVSGEVWQLPAGAVSMAVGFDLRREGYNFAQDVDATRSCWRRAMPTCPTPAATSRPCMPS
jgi:iron complex outermembrane receptor protein